jgi:molecular chaperone DnaK
MTKLIDANTTIPCKKEEVFSTAETNQTLVTVHVLQGERPMARDNKSLGKFNLEGILPAMRGVPKIVVSFDLDVNGILSVTAKDQATGKEQSIRIEGSGKLSDDEINRIKAEAEKYAEKDKELKEEAEAVNKGDSLIFAQEKLIKDQEGNLTQEEKSTLEGLVNDMKQAVKERDVKKINELEDSINKKWQDVSQRIYSNSQKQDTTTEAETPNNDGIQDADFEEVK